MDQQPGIADRFPLVQRHDIGDPRGIGGEEAWKQPGQQVSRTARTMSTAGAMLAVNVMKLRWAPVP